MTEKKFADETLAEWRKRYMDELDGCMRVWIEIRDAEITRTIACPHCKKPVDVIPSARDRNEAAKNIARSLSALAPDKVTEKAPTRAELEAQRADLDPKHKRELDDILSRGI